MTQHYEPMVVDQCELTFHGECDDIYKQAKQWVREQGKFQKQKEFEKLPMEEQYEQKAKQATALYKRAIGLRRKTPSREPQAAGLERKAEEILITLPREFQSAVQQEVLTSEIKKTSPIPMEPPIMAVSPPTTAIVSGTEMQQTLQQANVNLQNQLESLQVKYQQVENVMERQTQEITNLSHQVSQLQQSNKNLIKQNTAQAQIINEYERTIQRLETQNDQLDRENAATVQKNTTLSQQLEKSKTNNQILRNNNQQLRQLRQEAMRASQTLAQELEQVILENEELKQQLSVQR